MAFRELQHRYHSMIETRLLRQFIAVAEELHFRRAAERLHMAQPPLSQAIRKLEYKLGVNLFERSNRSVVLTPAGVSFLQSAQRILGELEAGADRARRIAAGVTGRLTIMFVATAHFELLPGIVRTFRLRLPDVELRLREATTAEQIDALGSGEADVGLLRRPGIAVPGLAFERIAREEILVALPHNHSQAMKPNIPLAALAREGFVATPRAKGIGFYDQLIGLCHAAGFSPQIVQEARQIETIVGLVAGGLGVALVPASAASKKHKGVVFRPLEVDAPDGSRYMDLLVGWDASRASPARDNFLAITRQAA